MDPGARRIRLMLVDDDELVLETTVAVMRLEADFELVGTATNLDEALQVAVDVRPDVVMMDYGLPDGDGVTGTRLIRDAVPAARVVMLTGWDDPETRAAAFEAGCSGFVTKGVRLDELADVIRAVAGAADPDRS